MNNNLTGINTLFYRFPIAFLAICLLPVCLMGQAHETVTEAGKAKKPRHGFLFMPHGGFGSPGGDLAKRFGSHGEVGGSVLYKTNNNWLLGLEGTYLFGNNVNENPIAALAGPKGYIFGSDGSLAQFTINERGFRFPFLKADKLIPIRFWRNSGELGGIVVGVGAGFFQHYIHYEDQGRNIAQLRDDYGKGYDRLTSGPALSQRIGFLLSGNSNLANVMVSFEAMQAFTHSNRFNFDLGSRDSRQRLDLTFGIRFTWILPVLSITDDDYYYY